MLQSDWLKWLFWFLFFCFLRLLGLLCEASMRENRGPGAGAHAASSSTIDRTTWKKFIWKGRRKVDFLELVSWSGRGFH